MKIAFKDDRVHPDFIYQTDSGRTCLHVYGHIETEGHADFVSIDLQASALAGMDAPAPEMQALFHQARHLVSAAPELLEACKAAIPLLKASKFDALALARLVVIETAIAKAEGQS